MKQIPSSFGKIGHLHLLRHSKGTQNQFQTLMVTMVWWFICYNWRLHMPRVQWSIWYGGSLNIFLESKITTTPTIDSESSRVNLLAIFKMELADLWKHLNDIVACASKVKICNLGSISVFTWPSPSLPLADRWGQVQQNSYSFPTFNSTDNFC